ncbi:MAG TPA: KR domain-containing protein [Streptosporangiaceae bacterium]|nr:KR domain-containing protein [Streptosporangiaceae bacterium]
MSVRRSGHFRAKPTAPAASATTTATATASTADSGRIAGIGPWARCYAEQLLTPGRAIAAPGDGPWRVHTGGCGSAGAVIGKLFAREQAASRTVALLGRTSDEGTVQAALLAAQDAIGTGTLVAISPDPGLAGFWASLHAEHPGMAITAIRAPLTTEGVRTAGKLGTEPGRLRELVVTAGGICREPAMSPLTPAVGGFPVGPDDVVLITRGSGAAGLVLAQVLACSGAAVAIIGRESPRRDSPGRDDAVLQTLEQLRLGGAAIGYEVVDLGSAGALSAAVRRIELRLGRVTAVAHATVSPPSRPVAGLTPADLRTYVLSQTSALGQLVTSVRARDGIRRTPADQLRLIMTFGSVLGRYGLAQESLVALSAGVLADYGEQLASAGPGCRALHVDWPAWAGADLGERPDLAASLRQAGYASMPLATGSRLLLKLLAAGDQPARVAIHGRVGHHAPVPIAVTAASSGGGSPVTPRRFTGRIRLQYPDAELITEAALTSETDPYLADYLIDGVCVLPPAMAIEAMAQVASALAGAPMRSARGISMSAPVVIAPGQRPSMIRICAQDADGQVAVVIRAASTGYAVDHFRAAFSPSPPDGKDGATADGTAPATAGPQAKRRWSCPEDTAGPLEPAEIYGPVCFQAGRFARLTSIRLVGGRAATAVVSGPDDRVWFGPASADSQAGGRGEPEFLLGSPAVTDAATQLIQVCVPHRRLFFAGCESASFGDNVVADAVTILAAQVAIPAQDRRLASAAGAMPSVPKARSGDQHAPGSGQPETVWNVHASDAAGQVVMSLRGLRMRESGSLPRTQPWPVQQAGCFLERAAAEVGLDPDLQVRVGRRAEIADLTDGDGWIRATADPGLEGLSLLVRASKSAGCAWRTVTQGRAGGKAGNADAWLAVLDDERITCAPGARYALARALASCTDSDPAADLSVTVRQVAGADWLVLHAGQAAIASTLLTLHGAAAQVAIAIMTGGPPDARRASDPARQPAPGPARQHRAAVSR